jgi:CheY-like chemotaxis protein
MDSQKERAESLGECLFNRAAAFQGEQPIEPELYIRATNLYKFVNNTWEKQIEQALPIEKVINIRLRHKLDGVKGYAAELCIVYSGAEGGCSNQQSEAYGFEHGIPFKMPSGNARTVFLEHHAEALIRYITNGSFPPFLKGRFFDADLKKVLQESTNLRATFHAGLFAFFSQPTVKTLVIGPEMPKEPDFFQVLDSSLPETYADENKARQRIISFLKEGKPKTKIQPEYLRSEADFDKASGKGFDQYDLAILPAELTWTSEHNRSDIWGIAAAAALRRRGFRGLIVLESPLPARITQLMRSEQTTYFDLLRTGYTYVWDTSGQKDGGVSSLPVEKQTEASEAWKIFSDDQMAELKEFGENAKPQMSEAYLREVQDLLTPTGKFSSLFHDYKKYVVKQDKEITIEETAKFWNDVSPLMAAAHAGELERLQAEFEQLRRKEDSTEGQLYDFVIQNRNKLESWLLDSGQAQTSINIGEMKSSGGVLVLEDDEKTMSQICKLLEDNQILYWKAKNSEDALEKLRADKEGQLQHSHFQGNNAPANSIKVVLVDIRLERPSGRWQLSQGYDFIDQVQNTTDHYVSCIAFTQKERSMMRSAKVAWLPKSVLRDNTLSGILIDKIQELAEKNFEASLPDTALWIKGYTAVHDHSYSVYMKRHRMDTLYKSLEASINEVCDDMLKYWHLLDEGNNEDIEKQQALISSIEKTYSKKRIGDGIRGSKEAKEQRDLFIGKLMARRAALTIAVDEKKRSDSIYKEEDYDALLADICYFLVHLKMPDMGVKSGTIKDIENGLLEYLEKNIVVLNQGGNEKRTTDFLRSHCEQFFDGIRESGKSIAFRDRLSNQQGLLNKHLGLGSNINEWIEIKAMLVEERRWLREKGLLDG